MHPVGRARAPASPSDRVRAGVALGGLPEDVRGQLTDGLIDELLEGRRGEAEVLGADGLGSLPCG